MLSRQSSQPKNQSVSSFIVSPTFRESTESADAESFLLVTSHLLYQAIA
jgi:hypothetical protein